MQPIQRFSIKIHFTAFTINRLQNRQVSEVSAETSVPLRRARRPPEHHSVPLGRPRHRPLRILRTWNRPGVTRVWPGLSDPNPGACYLHFWVSALIPQKPDEPMSTLEMLGSAFTRKREPQPWLTDNGQCGQKAPEPVRAQVGQGPHRLHVADASAPLYFTL